MKLAKNRTLWELTAGQRLRYGLAIAAMGFSNVFLFGVPLVSKSAIDGVFGDGTDATGASEGVGTIFGRFAESFGDASALWAAAGAIVLLTALAGVFQYLRGRWAATASEAIVRGVRNRMFSHLEALPCSYHDRADTGDLIQRCTSDVETVRVFLSGQVVEIGRAVLLVATVIPVLLWLDVPMTIAALALFPVIIAFAWFFFGRIQRLFLEADEAEGAMTGVLQENLTGIRVVRAFARQHFECEKFAERNGDFRDRMRRLIEMLAWYWGISDFLCVGQIGITLFFGSWWLLKGHITVGTLFAFLTYESIIMWPVRLLGRVLSEAGKALVALGRLREILEQPEETATDTATAEELPPIRGEIEVEGLTFAHIEGDPVLRDVTFRIEAGSTLALLGPPGSGKSTLIQILLRMYDYGQGSIRLDGHELTGLSRKLVRSNVGAVLQEPFLYSKTLAANVRVGRWEASHEEVVDSASAACIHDAIESFDHGYDTLVGERGVTLSGGQRQRVALARALVKDPPILILDDALSAVDTATESRILGALEARRGRHTTIVIAHRLSSVRHADRILVFEKGEIVQTGTHAELIEASGPYRRLWRIQGALEREIEVDLLKAGGERS